jgi:hypothetical protein
MNRAWPLQLKITFAVSMLTVSFGFFLISVFPSSVKNSSIVKRQGIAENVICKDGKHDYSPKYIYVSGSSLEEFYFKLKGDCETIRKEIINHSVLAYGYKPPLNKAGFVPVEVMVAGKYVTSIKESRSSFVSAIGIFFIFVPMLILSLRLYGFRTGKWSKNA